eukprot:Plantae.Rhodophyta-Purpureofilum_apyrenoidigerum.ctg9706.p2 GENE.Plantae.Rhodophyta-Purpureofilum_apyrenoidigerum.ctg9706~~Plantae.Rhodophyta-Purpureofilum_apyrenoidigerum.ctg9706.p2  ORF type:complete len:172 (-),score=31.90 Plantae.Rhodophyta-Purpureofilum_apyrenoidigerum.ctg9706:112-627(-)
MAFVGGAAALGSQQKVQSATCSAKSSAFAGSAVAARPTVSAVSVAPVPVMPEIEAMRHRNRVKKLNRPADQRKALMRALTTELIRHGRITTTLERCKEVRKYADHMIQLSKEGSLHSRRQAMGFIYDKQLVHALFEQGAERYRERNGGYTRVLRTMPRKGDNASMGIIELV